MSSKTVKKVIFCQKKCHVTFLKHPPTLVSFGDTVATTTPSVTYYLNGPFYLCCCFVEIVVVAIVVTFVVVAVVSVVANKRLNIYRGCCCFCCCWNCCWFCILLFCCSDFVVNKRMKHIFESFCNDVSLVTSQLEQFKWHYKLGTTSLEFYLTNLWRHLCVHNAQLG